MKQRTQTQERPGEPGGGVQPHPLDRFSARVMPWSFLALLGIGVMLIVLGYLKNDVTAVFSKAATVCLECIGIG